MTTAKSHHEEFNLNILAKFCLPEDCYSRYQLQYPFQKDGWLYATDARIAIRIPCGAGRIAGANGRKVPDMEKLGWNHASHSLEAWKPWPEASAIISRDDQLCEACNGEGRYLQYAMDYFEWERPTQRTITEVKCPRCKGTRTTHGPSHIMLDSQAVGVEYDRLIRLLPDVQFIAIADEAGSPGMVLFTFRCDHGDHDSEIRGNGIIMPRTIHER